MTEPPQEPLAELLAREPASFAPETPDFDLLTDVLLPSALFIMLGSLVWFLLDVRAAAVEEPTRLLRWIFFCFMLAVVGIARIRSRDGAFDAAPYAIALLLVMGLFGYLFAFGGGAFGGGYGGGNPMGALLFNYLVIAFIWFGGNYIVSQTTIDPEAVEVDAALLSSEEWEQQGTAARAVRHRPHPGRAVMVLSVVALGVFGIGHQQLAGHPFQSHAFACMVVFLGSGLAVLAMSALAGLALYVRQRGTYLPPRMLALWLGLALPWAALLLALAQAAPKLEPQANSFHPRPPAWLERWLQPGGTLFEAPYGEATAPSREHQSGLAGESGQSTGGQPGDQSGQPGAPAPAGSPGGEAAGQRGQPAGEGGAAAGGQTAGPGESPRAGADQATESADGQPGQRQGGASGAGEEGAEDSQDEPAARDSEAGEDAPPQPGEPPAAPRANPPEAPAVDWWPLLKALLVVAAGLLLAAGLVVLGRRLKPRATGGQPGEQPVVTRDPFADPFGPRSPFRGRPPAEVVVHVYRAFQAYAALVGKPRHPEMTAHDYLRELPPSMASWRERIEQLTDLYAAAEYTPGLVDETDLEDLRAIWERLMQAVREVRGG